MSEMFSVKNKKNIISVSSAESTQRVVKVKGQCNISFTVNRMVKYTGYGNCAGLLANRGLMLGGQGQGDYSSDSEDSETEEYSNLADK